MHNKQVKRVALIKRKPHLSFEQFKERWIEHTSLTAQLNNIKKYTISIAEPALNDNDDYGIYFYEENSNNTISGNTANENGDAGISLHWYSNNTIIKQNTINHNRYYVIVQGLPLVFLFVSILLLIPPRP